MIAETKAQGPSPDSLGPQAWRASSWNSFPTFSNSVIIKLWHCHSQPNLLLLTTIRISNMYVIISLCTKTLWTIVQHGTLRSYAFWYEPVPTLSGFNPCFLKKSAQPNPTISAKNEECTRDFRCWVPMHLDRKRHIFQGLQQTDTECLSSFSSSWISDRIITYQIKAKI